MLHIAPDLELSLDYVTKTGAILAQRRKGKTYTASVIAEELVRLGIPWVTVDPTGAWWGMRAGANGDAKGGLPVTILGGHHGDIPLERTAGKLIAELVVDHPGWYVLDLSLFESKEADRQFATDFAERLYRRKGQAGGDTALHLFVDEADLFVPQQSPSGDKRMVGAFEALVRRGGIRGIGTTLISQRAAVVNKNVLEMLDMLIVLRTVGPNDRRAVDGYIEAYAEPEERKLVMSSLAGLNIGEAWVYEPGEKLLQRVQIRERTTFNSSATPKAGEKRIQPKRLAAVDLATIEEQMAETVERAKADDPKELRKEIAALRRQVADQAPAEPIVEFIEIPTLDESLVARVEAAITSMRDDLLGSVDALVENINMARVLVDGKGSAPETVRRSPTRPAARTPAAPQRPRPAPVAAPGGGHDGREPSAAERQILVALAQHPEGWDGKALAVLVGKSFSGGFRNYLSALRTDGYIVGANKDQMRVTEAGLAALGSYEPLPAGRDLLDYWLTGGRLSNAEKDVLRAVDQNPGATGQELAAACGKEYSGGFRNYLSKLRTLRLIEGSNGEGMYLADLLT